MASRSPRRRGGVLLGFQGSVRAAFLGRLEEAACPEAEVLTGSLLPEQAASAGGAGWLSPLKKLKWSNAGDDSATRQPRCAVALAPHGLNCRSENRFILYIYP